MKRNAQKLAMTGSLSTYNAAGAQRNGRMGAIDSPRIFLTVLTALALVMGTMVPAAFADTGADATSATGATTTTNSIFADGSGTEEDPYIIQTADQLNAFRDSVNKGTAYEGQTVKLNADIDISGNEWTPIGTGTRKNGVVSGTTTPFKGTFDGNNHTVVGLTITKASSDNSALGFFGVLDGATVKNLTLTNVNIDVPTSLLAGGIAGIGLNSTTLTNDTVSGTISGHSNIGGLIGSLAKEGIIEDSTNNADVTGAGTNVGVFVGELLNYASLKDDINNGKLNITDLDKPGAITNPGTTDQPTQPDADKTDPTQTPAATTPDGATTEPALSKPDDASTAQQAGTAEPNDAADNATQTGANLQQTGDDALRVAGVAAVLALTAGATMLIARRRSL